MKAAMVLSENRDAIYALCRKYAVKRLRLFGSALRPDWNSNSSDFDFLAEFNNPAGMNAFEQLMGFITDMQNLLGRNVDVVDWNAAKNPFFKRHADRQAQEFYAA